MQTTEILSKARACVQGERCRRVCSPLYNEEMEVTGPEQSERRQEDCKADIGLKGPLSPLSCASLCRAIV